MAVQLELSQMLVDGLTFENQIVGLNKAGRPIFEPTPPGTAEWIVRDGGKKGQSGLLLRITSGAMTWCVRRKMGGKSTRRAMGRARKADDFTGRVLTLEEARKRARAWLVSMEENIDPLRVREDHLKQTKLATEHRRLTMAVAFADFIEAKRKHKAKLGEEGRLEVGVGKRRTADPKLRDSSTADRIKVQRWLDGSPMWQVPVGHLTEEVVSDSLTPLLKRASGGQPKITWGPKSVSKGTLDKIYRHLDGAWWRAAKILKLGVGRDEGPLRLWRQNHESDWPADRLVHKALDTSSPDHILWLKALLDMQRAAHDPAVFIARISPRSRAIKPHLSVLVDFYLLLILWGTRATETQLLEWSQVDLAKRLIWLSEDTTKNAALDVVPLTPWAAEILQERKRLNELWRPDAPGRYVFPSREHGHPISSPRGVLVALAEKTGIALTAHDLRRSLAREIGSDDDLLHTARLLVSGAALHHGAGKGGSRVAGATHRYLEEKANILRPLYQKRENRLRELVGLQVEKPKPELDVDAVLDRMRADPEFFQQVMQTALRPKT